MLITLHAILEILILKLEIILSDKTPNIPVLHFYGKKKKALAP